MASVYEYRPPADGTAESADPHFVSKVRGCGRCGKEFTTTARNRYFGPCCRDHWKGRRDKTRHHGDTARLGSSASNAYWKY